MAKHPHPSGRPIRPEIRNGRQYWNYPPDPGVVYATPRLRPKPGLVDAIGFRFNAGGDEAVDEFRAGFVDFDLDKTGKRP